MLVPTGEAPHKRIADDPGRELRLAMTRLAAADDSRFSVSTLEVEREGPSYTYETLELLAERKRRHGAGVRDGGGRRGRAGELARAASGWSSWRGSRWRAGPGVSDAEVGAVLRSLGAEGRATMLEMPQFGVSSSAVRERAAAGRPLRYLVPEAVARFIEEKGIYAVSAARLGGAGAAAGRAGRLEKARARSSSSTCASLVSYTDFLAICTARNERQAQAIVDEVQLRLKQEQGLLPGGVEGEGAAGWIVLDYLDCVLHVFTAEARRALPARGALARGAAARVCRLPQDGVRGHLYGAAHG